MKPTKYGLFLKRRFLPIFVAQFLGGFNDNLLRSGLVVLIAYAHQKNIPLPMENAEVLVTICSALLVFPFILFSFLAGQMADKFEKGMLVRYTKVAEVGIMLAACYGFATNNIYLLMAMLFVSGTHSTFFGPIKYSILPDHLRKEELLAGNGFVSAGTYLGILGGLITGGLLVEMEGNVIGYTAVAIALVGLIASFFIEHAEPAVPDMKLDFHMIRGTIGIIRHARESGSAFRAIMGLSWFLMIGSVYMAQFANYASLQVKGDHEVYTLFLVVFSVGIAMGSVLCDKLLKGEITPKFSPVSLLGISVFTVLMVMNTPAPTHEGLLNHNEFITDPKHWPLLGTMLMVALCGGIYMVPLYALLQTESGNENRSRVIAASNLFDSLFMTVAAIICAVLLAFGMKITDLFLIIAAVNLVMCIYARKASNAFANRAS